MSERMRRICFFIPPRMKAELQKLSQFDGRSAGEIVRGLLEQKLAEARRQEPQQKTR